MIACEEYPQLELSPYLEELDDIAAGRAKKNPPIRLADGYGGKNQPRPF
jgi:hypothetical protein